MVCTEPWQRAAPARRSGSCTRILGHSIGVRLNYSSQKAPCFLQHQAGDGPALSPAWRQSSVCF